MDPRTIANQYYDAWRDRAGDMSGVPLAADFSFRGPVASFDSADGFRAMAARAGAAVRDFRVRQQFVDGEQVCSIIDWEMAMLPGTLTAAELLRVRDGRIVSGELIYDAEELRKAMAAPPIGELLARAVATVAGVLARVGAPARDAPSPCAAWTVRQVGNHVVGSTTLLARVAEREPVDDAEFDPQKLADTDHLGADPVGALRAAGERCVTTFSRAGVLEERFPQPVPDAPGAVLANICLVEFLVHGWDIARGAGVEYRPDGAVVAAAQAFTRMAVDDEQRATGLFGPAHPVGPDADPWTATLAHLGRRA
jgi:uncharacterized protein (TIGR03086 family)